MRKPATAILFCSLVLSVTAQSDTIFPNVSGYWDMTTITWDWDGQDMNFEFWPHQLEYYPEFSVEEFGFTWGEVWDQNGPVGLIAVDSARVWYRATAYYFDGYVGYGDTTMRVLYDFDLEVGDTAYFQNQWPELEVIVEYIDTVLLGGMERRHFMFSNGDEWIQGMGSRRGLLGPLVYFFENACDLNSFCGNYIDEDGAAYTSCLATGARSLEDRKGSWSAYPNPCSDAFFLEGAELGSVFSITDLRGREVNTGRITNARTTMDMTGIAPGMYHIRIGDRVIRVAVR